MLSHQLTDEGLLIITPTDKLSAGDFTELTHEVDAYILAHGELPGVLIHVKEFPGWEDLSAFVSHIKFVRDHHQLIARVAAVTDAPLMSLVRHLVDHFTGAEVRHFVHGDKEAALAWLRQDD